jgi:hypothetical protein
VNMTHKSTQPERLVAIVTPVVKFPLSADEEISMWHLRKYLGGFERYVIGLENLPKELSDFTLRSFPMRYFKEHAGYNRLMLKKEFYRAFSEYEYILIYQLDCLVFASNLEDWCEKGWDYVGAPWLADMGDPLKGFSGVGNGGLSLRRVQSALKVLGSKQIWEDPKTRGSRVGSHSEVIYERLKSRPRLKRMAVAGRAFLHRLGYRNNVRWLTRKMADEKRYEDLFWAYEARKVMRAFRVPEPREALEFSFEMVPRYCFEVNSGRLPFGCHAWSKYDRKFWEPYLLK